MTKNNRLTPTLSIACVQMNSTNDVAHNLATVDKLMATINQPVDVVVLPEVFNYRNTSNHSDVYAEPLSGKSVDHLQQVAQQYNTHIIAGSITEASISKKAYNTCAVIQPNGDIMATYRKMHLFDVSVQGKTITESNRFMAGTQPEIVTISGWKIGLSICYDLRFPELYRWYFKKQVDAVVVPSSFTYSTGEKHWHVLCRARAIENQCYVLAPNQCGLGAAQTQTYGHSLVADPLGSVVAEANDTDETVIQATLDAKILDSTREAMPVLSHCKMGI
jgi:deaminated glutathione amidase